MRLLGIIVIACLLAACSTDSPTVETTPTAPPTVRILLAGDVMTGRGVADLLATQPGEAFAGIRHLVAAADVAGANLESPLTDLPHTSPNENALEAAPATAKVLSDAGFDVMSLANNHATDAGPNGLVDTIDALIGVNIEPVGAGANREIANSPVVVETAGRSIGFIAFDATGVSDEAGMDPGVATWNQSRAIATIEELRPTVDAIVVSVHGGTEYLPTTDPGMAAIGEVLTTAGADVVWGHGAHVVQPVSVIASDNPTVVATSLGNFLFDQTGPDRTTGYMLEVLVDTQGVVAYRVGVIEHPDRRVEFVKWLEPTGDAVWLHGSWWTLTRSPATSSSAPATLAEFRHGDLIATDRGDVTGDGTDDVVASFRRPHRTTPFMELHPELQWADKSGRSAHLGVYDPDGLGPIWVAGSVLMPVAGLAVCDGSIATIHDSLDDPSIVAAGAWTWNGFGFDTAPDIPGTGTPSCADIDGDGRTDPVIVDR